MKNEFILCLKHHDLPQKEKIFRELLDDTGFEAKLVGEKILNQDNEAFFRIKISASSLIRLKKKLDQNTDYEGLELFEFREW